LPEIFTIQDVNHTGTKLLSDPLEFVVTAYADGVPMRMDLCKHYRDHALRFVVMSRNETCARPPSVYIPHALN
jgi:hypothetical protein